MGVLLGQKRGSYRAGEVEVTRLVECRKARRLVVKLSG
jgi:hypothetical protein